MKNLNREALQFLQDTKLWTVSTNGEEGPNGIPTFFHTISEDNKLIIANVFMKLTPKNLQADNRICVSVADVTESGPKGYLVKGTATLETTGAYADLAQEMTAPLRERGMKPQGGAIVVTVSQVVDSTPGPNNGTIL